MSECYSFDIEAVFNEPDQIGETESGLQRLAFSDYDNQKEFTPFQDIRNVAQVLTRAIETLTS